MAKSAKTAKPGKKAKRASAANKTEAATSDGPPRRKCGAMVSYYDMLENNPGTRQVLGNLEAATRSRTIARGVADEGRQEPVIIPVVVHVVHRTAAEKISAAQVKSQIEVLNKDFNATNPDIAGVPAPWSGIAGNARIRFALATVNPNGKKTTGIVYKKSSKMRFSQDDGVKFSAKGGADAWPSDRYLNIWVCNLGDGLLGYAQFPGGPANTDGVVILNTAFGTIGSVVAPFNLGRTTTHEVGHWLNLRHIWGDTEDCSGSDFIGDTPTQQFPNRGVPSFPHASCGNGPNGDMFMNYMDYVDDAAMFMFTKGQVDRMQVAVSLARPGFIARGKELTS